MRGPKPLAVVLTTEERQDLEALVRRHTAPQQLVLRARIVLAAADGLNNAQIARHLDVSLPTVRRWRERWLILQAVALTDLDVTARLLDVPRPGRPIQISDEQVCQTLVHEQVHLWQHAFGKPSARRSVFSGNSRFGKSSGGRSLEGGMSGYSFGGIESVRILKAMPRASKQKASVRGRR